VFYFDWLLILIVGKIVREIVLSFLLGLAGVTCSVSSYADVADMKAQFALSARPQSFEGISKSRLAMIDHYATKAPRALEGDLDSLVAYLVKPARTDQEKVRSIFKWITHRFSYSAHSSLPKGYFDSKALLALVGKGLACDGYGRVFAELAKRAGVEVQTIQGVAKSDGSLSQGPNHLWNAVKIEGKWLLVDPTWGAGYVSGARYTADSDEYYFLAPVDSFSLSHFDPEDRFGIQRGLGMDWSVFKSMPVNAPNLVYAGFQVSSLVSFVRNNPRKELVETFNQPFGAFNAEGMPIEKKLGKGARTLALDSNAYDDLMVVQGNDWTPFYRSGQHYSLTSRFKSGELLVMGKKKGAEDYEALLEYQVQ
jgi:hypothetical protein